MSVSHWVRPTLKICSFPIHWLGEVKNSYKLPAGRNLFLQSIRLKRYAIKIFEKVSSWSKKMILCIDLYSIFMFNYVQLCWYYLMLIQPTLIMMIVIKIRSCVPTKIKLNLNILANLRPNSLLYRPTLIRYVYVPWSRLIKMRWQTWPFYFDEVRI